MTTDFTPRRSRPKSPRDLGNMYPEIAPGKFDTSILAELDKLSWAERLEVPPNLSPDELLIEIARCAGKVQELRAPLVLARVRLIELTLYACERVGLNPIAVAKAAGMRRQALNRWLVTYRSR